VRGFFENGGRVCYVSRVCNASFDALTLNDQAIQPTIRVHARKSGVTSPQITVAVDANVHAVNPANAKLFRPTATVANASGTTIVVTNADDAARFRPTDLATIEGTTEKLTVLRVDGRTVRLTEALAATHTSGTLRLANLEPGDTIFRVEEAAKLSSGSVIRLSQDPGGGASPVEEIVVVKSVTVERLSPTATTYRVEIERGLTQSFNLAPGANDITVESFEFTLTVAQGASSKPYPELSMHPSHPNYYRHIINNDETGLIYAEPVEPPNTTLPPDNRPNTIAAAPLTGGTNDAPASLASSDYKNALAKLEAIDDVNMVAIPDRTDLDVQLAMITHCQNMHDRFAILDAQRGAQLFGSGSVAEQRGSLDSPRGFAALYYPWLRVPPAAGNEPILVPPSGHVAGIFAQTDNKRGVHKAPAGTEALINGALGVERTMSDIDQGELNKDGINVIRVFNPGGRPTVWGARTTATDTNWRYVSTRRLFLFLEESIEEGIRWAVFEPNNLQLWQ
jgi:hypothetical protein